MKKTIKINNKETALSANPTDRLLDALRDGGYHTVKEGCGEGECGACSVILNSELINSCLILFGQIRDGDEIITAECEDEMMAKIKRSFLDAGAVQCGFCTPGMLIAAYALLSKNKSPSAEEIKHAIAGNLCRCTGYAKIIDAIKGAYK